MPTAGASATQQRLSGTFQLLLGLYIVLTSNLPTLIQALAYGIEGDAGSEFAAAMATQAALVILLLAPVLMLANHPLGILHPVIIAVVTWPILTGMASTVQDLGGWAGVLAGTPVQTPHYDGLVTHAPSSVWNAITKYNAMLVLNLLGTYMGFWLWRGGQGQRRAAVLIPDPVAVRPIILGIFGLSVLVLAAFVQSRGGLLSHILSLGNGRFRELSGDGPVIVLANIGSIATFLWVASRPQDVKSPTFLACVVIVTVSQFISNGSRSSAIETPMITALVWTVRTQRIPWRIAILLGPVLFISIGMLGVIRTLSWSGGTVTHAVSSTGVSGSFAATQSEIAQRHASSAPIPVVARGFEVTNGPLLGSSYVAALTAFVPRALWEGKPRGTGSLYIQLFHGGSDTAGGIPVSPTAEMYWNFGIPGVLFFSMLYGILLRAAYQFLWRHYPDPFVVVFYVIFVTGFDMGTRKLVDFQQSVALLLICYFIIHTLVRRVRTGGARQTQHPGGPGWPVLAPVPSKP